MKQLFLEHKDQFLTMTSMIDTNKLKAMKIMSSLALFYHYKRSLGGLVCLRMVELSVLHGHCEESLLCLAIFAAFLAGMVGDIDEASSLARMVLSLLSKSRHNVNLCLPAVVS